MAKLRPRARIIRTIGDQLISGPEAALIELVKNAYDADSPLVHITITPQNSDRASKDSIVVIDRGHGMSASDLTEKWFEPATSDKVERRKSPGDRTMLGAKGVGRFATARLGSYLNLKTVKKSEAKTEVSEITLNWADFEHSKYLDEVDIEVRTHPGNIHDVPGVTLEIKDLRDSWTENQLRQLVKELRRIASPIVAREDQFKIYLDISAFNSDIHGFDGQALVSGANRESDSDDIDPTEIRPLPIGEICHYTVNGIFKNDGSFSGTFINRRGDHKPQPIEISATDLTTDEAACGSLQLKLNIYDREGDAVVDLFQALGLGAIGRLEAKKVLDENIGIGIYRNGFRIRPYGDAETDWLELERMRVQNPSKKLGLNQVWGMVEIEDEFSSGLIERSSREGLEHNGSFERLQRLITDLLTIVETIRQDFRQTAGLSRKTNVDTDEVKERANLRATTRAISDLPVKYREKLERAMKQDSLALKTSIGELETYQQALASHSTLGLVVAQVLHDGRRFLSDVTTRSKRLVEGAPRLEENSKFGEHFRNTFNGEASSIHSSAGQLNKLFRTLDPISGKKRGRPKNFALTDVLDRCIGLFSDSIKDHSIELEILGAEEQPLVVGYEADLMAALLNIIDNAIHWLGVSSLKPRKLKLSTVHSKKYVRLSISNNGALIDERFYPRLFSPGFSLKTEGSGIGLAIAREAMRASKGDVAFDPDADETTFVIEMKRA
ncbi:sensor histidine kinase [Herbaspirillum robiniae]|uniref:histidine kinase n=1 Tax=Herbaspirillum robiniae TaxID=2014887 RepID=A0A246WKZ2_9BURK|nr:sensor histidine kinase [Herbaspirillum robiniae]OWY26926.1 histidine kinase [Herbaspirillum robiniae]